jgi:hypothetical protein
VPEALCLSDGFPNGTCSRPCEGVCPDRDEPEDTDTLCVDGSPFGAAEGVCVSQCDLEVFPGRGCAEGYACVERNRYGRPTSVQRVCLPAVPHACPGEDELLEVDYPNAGKLFIPHEARCGGRFDLVVMLHGINLSANRAPSLGGGLRLELLARHLVDGNAVRPVILAEPVHIEGTSARLYGPGFDPVEHLQRLEPLLEARNIKLSSLSYIGHSGAGCHEGNGMYKILERLPALVPAHAPRLALWGLMDVCYEDAYHWELPIAAFAKESTAVVNMYSVQGDPDAFEEALLEPSLTLPCSPSLYSSCLVHAERPWCSYRTRASAGIGHENNPYFFMREVFPHVFPAQGKATVCGR